MLDSALHDIIDLDRYPVDQPDSEAGMTREAENLAPGACRYDQPRAAYEISDQTRPEGHPRAIEHPCRYFQILNHQISNDSSVRAIYLWEPLREFLRRVLRYDELHRSACPHLTLSIQIEDRGDCNGWHFDGNDAVFSLLLQESESGGHFEYAPYIRNDADQNYGAVEAGERRRIIALFAYDRAPNQIYQQAYIDELRGKSSAA